MELPFDLAIPLLGLYPKNPETPIQENLWTPMFIENNHFLIGTKRYQQIGLSNGNIKLRTYTFGFRRKLLSSSDA